MSEETDDEEIDLGSEDTDESEDEDYVPKENRGVAPKKKKRKLKKKKKRVGVNIDELSLPKPQAVLERGFDLSASALTACVADDSLKPANMKSLSPSAGSKVELVIASPPTRSTPGDPGMVAYREIYSKQLPGMPFYYDAVQALLTVEDSPTVVAGATFQLIELMTMCGRSLLILDILALAVNRDVCQKGLGSKLVQSLKAIARREAATHGARPLILTQADLSCVGFWAKQGLTRALDANALTRSLRRASDHTIFLGATPMALLMPDVQGSKRVRAS